MIDIWSFGCILAELFSGTLFNPYCTLVFEMQTSCIPCDIDKDVEGLIICDRRTKQALQVLNVIIL